MTRSLSAIPAETAFKMFGVYRTRGTTCKRDGQVFNSATVLGHDRDHLGRLLLIVEYADGRRSWVNRFGRTGLGHPHPADLTAEEA